MRKLLSSAAFLGLVATGTLVSAQGFLNNPASQLGNAVGRAAGQVQNMTRGTVGGLRSGIGMNTNQYGGVGLNTNQYGDHVGQGYGISGGHYGGAQQYYGGYDHYGSYNAPAYEPSQPTYGYGQMGHQSGGNMHAGSYSGYANQGVHTLRYDHTGREFICVGGERIYFDNSLSSATAGQEQRYEAGYGSQGENFTAPGSNNQSTNDQSNRDGNVNVDNNANARSTADTNLGTQADTNTGSEADVNAGSNAKDGARGNTDVNSNTDIESGNGTANIDASAEAAADVSGTTE